MWIVEMQVQGMWGAYWTPVPGTGDDGSWSGPIYCKTEDEATQLKERIRSRWATQSVFHNTPLRVARVPEVPAQHLALQAVAEGD